MDILYKMAKVELFAASERNDLSTIRKLLKEDPSLVSKYDMSGRTALHWSAWLGRKDAVRLMVIVFKADVNMTTTVGQTPLHQSVWAGHTDIAKFLLDQGAEVNFKDREGKRAIDYAWEMNHTECIRLLRCYGSAEHAQDFSRGAAVGGGAEKKEEEFKHLQSQLEECQMQLCAVLKIREHEIFEAEDTQLKLVASVHKQDKADNANFLKKLVECPVCYEIPSRTPVPCCKNGHIICSSCVRRLRAPPRCPLCNVKLRENVSLIAAGIIDKIKEG